MIALPNLLALPARTCSYELQRFDSSNMNLRHPALRLTSRANGRAPFAASLLYLAGCAARCANHLHMRLSSLSGLMKLAEALGFVSVDAFFVAVLLLLAATVLVCGVVMGARAWTYRYIWYEFDETEFSFYSGILNKRCTHVPYSKIQSVNERASLLQRLAGVRTVNIDTAGGASNKALVISYVERSAAEYLRRELFRRKHIEGRRGAWCGGCSRFSCWSGNVLDGAAAAIDDIRGVFAKDAVIQVLLLANTVLATRNCCFPPYAEGHRLAWLLQQ